MIFGVNFNGSTIPAGIQRMFASHIRVFACGHHRVLAGRGVASCGTCHADRAIERVRLVGVGQSEAERDAMVLQATNGHRLLYVEPRQTAAGVWYGIYT